MAIEHLSWAIRTALLTFIQDDIDPDDLQDLADFLAFEIEQSDVALPTTSDHNASNVVTQRTLEELEAMPMTSVIGPHITDMLGISTTLIPLVIDEILDNYIGGKPVEAVDKVQLDNIMHECELCERPAALTDHHLIPRSEHDLFVKRGLFTLEECRNRLAKLCRPCHSAVHRAKTTRELASEYNTTEKLLEIPEVARFAEWNAKRKVMATVVQRRKRR